MGGSGEGALACRLGPHARSVAPEPADPGPDEFLVSQIICVFLRFHAQGRASAFDTMMCLNAGGIGICSDDWPSL